jgi:hypothetical protein
MFAVHCNMPAGTINCPITLQLALQHASRYHQLSYHPPTCTATCQPVPSTVLSPSNLHPNISEKKLCICLSMWRLPTISIICTITSTFSSFYVVTVKDAAFDSLQPFRIVKRDIISEAADIR